MAVMKDGANRFQINQMKRMVASGVEPEEISRQLMIEEAAVKRLIKSFEMGGSKVKTAETGTKEPLTEKPKTESASGSGTSAKAGSPPTK